MRRSLPILIVGGGIGGMSAAIALARNGQAVELLEADADWRVYGAGITITGATYCAFAELGLLDELKARGFGSQGGTRICDGQGRLMFEIPGAPLRSDLPPIGGIMRPVLHEMLSREVLAADVKVRLGQTVSGWAETGESVRATFSDGGADDYAAIIMADGAFSQNRSRLFADTPSPTYTGQYCWRLVADRPAEIDRAHIYSADGIFAGLVPVSDAAMYMWLLEPRAKKYRIEPGREHQTLARIMAPFGGLLGQLREGLNARSVINVRPLDALLMPRPWHSGRVILIGDAAHATTPHLASGAGIAVEDAVVLARLLGDETRGVDGIEQAFARFMDLRWERCRDVVESSIAIGAMQQSPDASPARLGALVGAAEHRLQIDIWTHPEQAVA